MGILQLIHDAFKTVFGNRAEGGSEPVKMTRAEVDQFLDERSKAKGEKLDYQHSVVDLLKVLDLDSSLEARRDLAADLGYKGSVEDTTDMNIKLHGLLMKDLYEHKFQGD